MVTLVVTVRHENIAMSLFVMGASHSTAKCVVDASYIVDQT